MSYYTPESAFGASVGAPSAADAPLVVLFERDDGIAVPLLSHLRMAGYDVRSARTPVELFDTAQKHAVALVLVDLGVVAASRREFWVALDAQRRGRAMEVITFRVTTARRATDTDRDLSAHAVVDVEVQDLGELEVIVEAVRRRVPLQGGSTRGVAGPLPYAPAAPPSAYGPAAPAGHYGPQAAPPSPSLSYGPSALGNYPPEYAPGGSPGSPFQLNQPPGEQSPFAHPASVNPFAEGHASPFDQPLAGNPFASLDPSAPPPPARNPFVSPDLTTESPRGGAAPMRGPVTDAWVPPAVDELPSANGGWTLPAPGPSVRPTDDTLTSGWTDQRAPAVTLDTEPDFPTYDIATPRQRMLGSDDPRLQEATAPVSALIPVPDRGLNGQVEQALGTVLVEGALLSPRKLEVLKGIQRMLGTVDMDFKLGELALLFKFLSPDQLLAALLVSRGLVSPQQIAALGRIKQELGTSGMNYDLETLLLMFHILPAEELRDLRRELA